SDKSGQRGVTRVWPPLPVLRSGVNVSHLVPLSRGRFCNLNKRSTWVKATGPRREAHDDADWLELAAAPPKLLRVLVALDNTAARAGIKRAIEPHGLKVVGEASQS